MFFNLLKKLKTYHLLKRLKELGDRVNVAVDIEATQSNSNVQIASDDFTNDRNA